MIRKLVMMSCALAAPIAARAYQQPTVRMEPSQLQGSRPIEKQTEASVVRDYLESWDSMQNALDQNQVGLLDANFVGTARDKLANTIEEQQKIGVNTSYHARSHDLQFVFYSPEGSSIQLIDTVEYDEQVSDHGKVLTTKPMRQRYVVVLTPSEVRWRVRIFQSEIP